MRRDAFDPSFWTKLYEALKRLEAELARPLLERKS